MSYLQIKMCMCVDKDKLVLYSFNMNNFSLYGFQFENMAISLLFFLQYMSLHVLIIFLLGLSCVHIFFQLFAQPMSFLLNHIFRERSLSFQNMEYLPNKTFFVLLVQEQSFWWMEACFCVLLVQGQHVYVGVRDLDLGCMITFSTRVNKT